MDEIDEIRIAFQPEVLIMRLDDLLPLRQMTPNIAASRKYARIKSSIGTVGMIEPLAVAPQETDGRRMLLDGHQGLHRVVLRQPQSNSTPEGRRGRAGLLINIGGYSQRSNSAISSCSLYWELLQVMSDQ